MNQARQVRGEGQGSAFCRVFRFRSLAMKRKHMRSGLRHDEGLTLAQEQPVCDTARGPVSTWS